MTRVDVLATMCYINDIAAAMSFTGEEVAGLHEAVLFAVNCPESVVHHTQADVDAAVAAAAYPQLDEFKENNGFTYYKAVCQFFPPSNIDRK
jgi:hypothetical protein